LLRDRIDSYLRERGRDPTLKYIDPSYMIRSVPADPLDAELCLVLGQGAVHAAMAGRTNVMIGHWSRRFTHVPIDVAVRHRHRVEPNGPLWQRVVEATGQPADLGG
jgi:6-phosphofructokinase 1